MHTADISSSDQSEGIGPTAGTLGIGFRFLHPVNSGNSSINKERPSGMKCSVLGEQKRVSRLEFIKLISNIEIVTQKEQNVLCLPPHSLIISELILPIVISATTVAYLCVR